MPRATRKRRLLNPQKSQLVFVEQPQNGPRHDYGQQIRSAINPISFASDEPRQAGPGSSWVSSQFTAHDITVARRGGRGRRKNQLSNSTTNPTSVLLAPHVKRATPNKYPTLSFETSVSGSQRCPKSFHKPRPAPRVVKTQGIRHANGDKTFSHNPSEMPTKTPRQNLFLSIRVQKTPTSEAAHGSGSTDKLRSPRALTFGEQVTPQPVQTGASNGNHTPGTSAVFTRPHIESPEILRIGDSPSSSIFHSLFHPNQPKTPPRSPRMALLEKDTPERDYGLKVTWRRRKNLMRLLTERGQLLPSDTMIINQWT